MILKVLPILAISTISEKNAKSKTIRPHYNPTELETLGQG